MPGRKPSRTPPAVHYPRHAVPPFPAFALATALSTAALLVATRRGSRLGEWISKPLASLFFLGAALSVDALASPFGTTLFVGLVLSLVGDVLLIPKTRGSFLLGLVAFLLGHVAYAAAFVERGVSKGAVGGALLALAVPVAFVARWLLPSVEAKMKVPVIAYMTVITLMVAFSIGTVAAHGNALLVVGAVAFYLSDLAVARERFVAPGFVNRLWGLPLYYGAQLVLAYCAAPG